LAQAAPTFRAVGAYESPSSSPVSGLRLCFAFRSDGLAFSSGFAWLIGCPGGASGFLIPSNSGRVSFFDFLGEDFFDIRRHLW